MSRVIKKLLLVILLIWVISGSFMGGYLVGHGNIILEKRGWIKVVNKNVDKPREIDFSLFWNVWNKVDRQYIGNIKTKERVYGAISGMLNSLGDPYTEFFTPEQTEQFQSGMSGEFEGIGAEVGKKNNQIIIIAPIEGSPAAKSGIKANDVILKVDEKSTDGMNVGEVVNLIRGKAGTKVTLTIERTGLTAPLKIGIIRDVIKIRSVRLEMKEGNVAYLRVTQFGKDTMPLVINAAREMKRKNPQAIIIDLRNNPGGMLSTAIDLVSMFIKPGVVVQREYRNGRIEQDKTTQQTPKLSEPKLVVLINAGSASASEIFAGAIQDYKRGILIGEKSFGKGLVQDFQELPGGAALKMTTAKWLTPNGRYINGKGIMPDIVVREKEGGEDEQLARALEEAVK